MRAVLVLLVRTRAFQRPHHVPKPACPAAVPDASPAEYERVYAADCEVGAGLDERFYDFNRGLVAAVKGFLDVFLEGRDVPRFYVLETLARVPYFAYVSVLHLETFGHRDDDHVARIRVHFAEADNELHHLLMMEALGGNASVVDRCLAQTLAVGYFGYCCALYATNRRLAYHLSELIEAHAYEAYDDYLRREGSALKMQEPPPVIRGVLRERRRRPAQDALRRVRPRPRRRAEPLGVAGRPRPVRYRGRRVRRDAALRGGRRGVRLAAPDECGARARGVALESEPPASTRRRRPRASRPPPAPTPSSACSACPATSNW